MIELFKNSFIVIALQSMEEKVSELDKNVKLTDLTLGYQYDILTKETSFVCYNLDYSLRCSYEINKFIESTAHILESYKVSYDYKGHIDAGLSLVIDKEQGRENDQTQPNNRSVGSAKVSYIFNQNESGHNVSCGPVNIYFVQQSWLIGHEKSDVLFLSVLKYILKEISDEKKYVISTYDEDLYNHTYYFLQGNSYIFTDKINEFVEQETKFQVLLTDYAGIRGYEFPNFIFLLPFGKRYLKYRMIECFSRTTTELHIIADNSRQSTDIEDKQLIKKWRKIDCVKSFDCRFNRLTNTFNMFTGKLHVFSEKNCLEKQPKNYSIEHFKYPWTCETVEVKVRSDNYDYDDKSKALYCIINGDNVILLHEFCSMHGIDILTYRDENNNDMLYIAAKFNAEDILHMLIDDYGCDVNSINQYGDTPLHVAAHYGSIDTAKILLKNGAIINTKDSIQRTLLHLAAERGHADVVKLLLENAADINARDRDGDTPLHQASECGRTNIIQLLLKEGCQVNVKNNFDKTPLHLASDYGHFEAVKLLTENGADINTKNSSGNDCIDVAAGRGFHNVVSFIKSLK